MATRTFDVVVVGAGMAGASAAHFLAPRHRVLVLEREAHAGYHATGRSAAIYTEVYGNATVRALTVGGRPFFRAPPDGFAAAPLFGQRAVMLIGTQDQTARLDSEFDMARHLAADVSRLDGPAARALIPLLRPGVVAGAVLDRGAREIDVDALLQGFLRGARAHGAVVETGAQVMALSRDGGDWRIETSGGAVRAPVVVNAAGAWADGLARLAGVAPLGIVPHRRTVGVVPLPDGVSAATWPMGIDVDETFYFKPESGGLLISPADETVVEPHDAFADDLDVAVGIDRVQGVLDLPVRRVLHTWAGLRSFAADRTPVVGFDPTAPGFFWLAGQGGYGIQTAPAMGRTAAALAAGDPLPADLQDLGVMAAALSPGRFRSAPA